MNATAVALASWRAGDENAFSVLHQRFAPLLRARIVRSRLWPALAPRTHPDDVVQEIWLRAIPPAQTRFESAGPGSFLAFLGRIADRTLIDMLRADRADKRGKGNAGRSLQTATERAAEPRPCQSVEPTPTASARHSELVKIARDELTDREFEAWQRVEIDGFTTDECGLAMRCSGAAVRGLLLRSRAKLVRRFQSRHEDG